ncbi:MAG: hypothetical protein HYZ40_00485 [Rhodospirillales bacterium]|nr:hypothetical protein [Rhodospirillales bacterium]
MNVPFPATSVEIAAIRRRYLWMATSIFFLDLAITVIFMTASGSWASGWRQVGSSLLLLLGVNWLVVRYLFEPIRRYLDGKIPFEDIQRRLTQLPSSISPTPTSSSATTSPASAPSSSGTMAVTSACFSAATRLNSWWRCW